MRSLSMSGMTRRAMTTAIALSLFVVSSASAATIGLTGTLQLVSDGPTNLPAVPNNLALSSNGSVAFALDELSGFGHFTAEVNDGIYGNSNSWIGNGATGLSGAFIGIALPGSTNINSIAFGRDSGGEANQFTDRALGTYTLQFRNDGSTADDAGWTSIGTITYSGGEGPPMTLAAARHQFNFAAVDATAVRLLVPGTGLGGGTAIDEIELYSGFPTPSGLTLIETGPPFASVPANLANAPGATAFAKDVLGGGGFGAHQIAHLNDSTYGNSNSWIGDTEGTFAGVDLNGMFMIDRIAFGRSNDPTNDPCPGGCTDRTTGIYTVQYTTAANPDASTPLDQWITLGVLQYDGVFPDATPFLRHLYEFAPVKATGVRLLVSDGGLAGGIAIDEIEVFAVQVPEPASAMLLMFGVAGLVARRRQRQ